MMRRTGNNRIARKMILMTMLTVAVAISNTVCGKESNRDQLLGPKYQIRLEMSTLVPMRDGVRMSTDLYFPVGATYPLPVVLIRTPYDKNKLRPSSEGENKPWEGDYFQVEFFAGQGYVVAVQDLRGRFESEGMFIIGTNERQDGLDTIEWLAQQPWSNQKVGTLGCSLPGEVQLQLAAMRSPYYAAAIPQGAGGAYTGTNRTFAFVDGGAFELASAVGWFPESGMQMFYRPPPGTPDDVIRRVAPYFDTRPKAPPVDKSEALWWLPTIDIMKRIADFPTQYEEFISHGPADEFYERFDYVTDSDRFDIPALHVNSWYDLGIRETLELFNLMQTNAESSLGREHQYVIISPTAHCESEGATEQTIVGQRHMGDARLDYYGIYLRWFDHWLKGEENGVTRMPRIQYYLMGKNEWRTADRWPLPGTEFTNFYLRSDGYANSRYGTGLLSTTLPKEEPPDQYVYDPATPVPTVGGVVCCTTATNAPGGSLDQSDVEMRSDVLVFTSEPLERGIEVTGPLQLILYVSSSAKDTDFTGKLVDVQPDGTAFNLSDGILRARYRKGYDKSVWMNDGEIYEVRIDLHATGNYFGPGHRIRLEVSSSNFPRLDRNLNTGGSNYDEIDWVVARNFVHHSSRYPSHLVLPIVQSQ